MRTHRHRPASIFKRILAFLIDTLPIQLALYVVSVEVFKVNPIVEEALGARDRQAAMAARLMISGGTTLIWITYCILAELSPWRGTLGKKIMGIAVHSSTGGKLPAGRVIGRNLAKVLSYIPCYGGFLAAFVTHHNRAWHDMLSGAIVVESRS